MNTFLLITRREFILLTRNRMQLVLLALFFGTALYAIYYGNAEITRQQSNILYIKTQNAADQRRLLDGFTADTTTPEGIAAREKVTYPSRVRYFLNYYAIDEPTAIAKLSIGQRDVNPYYLQLNAQNLYLQLFKSEISNPRKLLAGNFDLAFVIIYLLPLLVIAFTYNLVSDEKERGTFPLLQVQAVSVRRIVWGKLLFWFMIITITVLMISLIAFIWCGISSMVAMGWWLLITLAYTACWLGITFLINTGNGGNAFNALCALGGWLLFMIVIPATLNLATSNDSAIDPTRLTDFIRRRQGLGESKEEKWKVLQRFYTLYPQYGKPDTSAANPFLDFQAYSAFATLSDQEARPAVEKYYQQIWQRQQLTAAFNLVNPAVNTQNMLNTLGHTGLENAFAFRESIAGFHWQLCDLCFRPLFAGRKMTRADFTRIPVYTAKRNRIHYILIKELSWLLLLNAILFLLAHVRLRNLI